MGKEVPKGAQLDHLLHILFPVSIIFIIGKNYNLNVQQWGTDYIS